MLTERGRVVSVEEDGLWVETIQISACESCSAKKGCGQSLLSSGTTAATQSSMTTIKAYFPPEGNQIWVCGDQVEVGIAENAMVLGALLSYLLPLVFLVCGAALGARLGEGDFASGLGAVIGLIAGAMLSRWHSRENAHNRYYHAVVIGR